MTATSNTENGFAFEERRNITRGASALLALGLVVMLLAGCDLPYAKAGASCAKEGDYAQDNTYVLKCENGRWVKKSTTEAADDAFEEAFGYRPGPNRPPPLVCRNSYDPACGTFHYVPEPLNRPMVLEASLSSTSDPLVLRLKISARDPDSQVTCQGIEVRVDDDRSYYLDGCVGAGVSPGASPACRAQYGRWDPPAPVPGAEFGGVDIPFSTSIAGTHTVEVRASSSHALCRDRDIYGSTASRHFTVVTR